MPDQTARITIEDVARQAAVSTMTVSRVLNSPERVSPRTAARVRAAIDALGYIPHQGARALASSKTNTLGLLLPVISGTFFSELIQGIEQVATREGYALLIYSTQGRAPDPHALQMPLGEHNTDGLLVFTSSLDDGLLRRLAERRFPLVLLHRRPPAGAQIPSVSFENKEGAYQMTRHLLACGHRRIAFLTGLASHEDALWRERGYRQGLCEAGLEADPDLIGPGDFNRAVAEKTVAGWLAQGVAIDAIFAADDESAIGALNAIHRAGLTVPDDIAVAGFDDSLLSRYLTPPLTTIHAPIEEAGRVAAGQLIDLIQGEKPPAETLLPTRLVIRDSCGGRRVGA